MAQIYISKPLIERIQNHKLSSNLRADLYGLIDGDGNYFLITCCLSSHKLHHDPSYLFPPFARLGLLLLHEKELPLTEEQVNEAMITCFGGKITSYTRKGTELVEVPYKIFSDKDLAKDFILARIQFYQEFFCRNKTADVKNAISDVVNSVSSSATCFRIRNCNILLQNNGKKVLSLKQDHYNVDTCLSDLFDSPNKKQSLHTITVDYFLNKSTEKATGAPIAQITNEKGRFLSTNLRGDVYLYISKNTHLSELDILLKKAITQQIYLTEYWLVNQLKNEKLLSPLKSYIFNQPSIGHYMTIIYPEDSYDNVLIDYRKLIHETLLFPLTTPLIRKGNSLSLQQEKQSRILINPHEGISKRIDPEDREIALVQGRYAYHHYMQDQFDDNKWGCAYRSLQTLVSWFRLQGYTDEPVPSHSEIQQILVNIKDKPSSFVGSKQWIGSTEVGFVLENLLNVSSKFISVSSGSDLAYKGRELSMHFKIEGTPIMIGGGVLAHTILGVDWSPITGDIKYLILDPHYTGGENLNQILKNGWCGWKGPDFWKANAYYNLCLPQRPKCF